MNCCYKGETFYTSCFQQIERIGFSDFTEEEKGEEISVDATIKINFEEEVYFSARF